MRLRAIFRKLFHRALPAGELGVAPEVKQSPPDAKGIAADLYRAAVAQMRASAASPVTTEKTWTIPKPPPGVIPPDHQMAMDSAIQGYGSWAIQNSIFAEGQMFLGYPYLAELSQRPEYRVISKTWSQEMTRKWIRLVSTGDTDIDDKTDKLKELEAELKRLKVQECFRQAFEIDGYFGRAHIYVELKGIDYTDREELKTSIGDGADDLSRAKVTKGSLQALRVIEPVWTYPNSYNANNPLAPDFFKPRTWFVMGSEIHDTRLLTFIGRPMPDLLKPAYSFGGLSLSQMAKPYVDNWLETRQSVNDAIKNFSIMVLLTDMNQFLNAGAAVGLVQRAELFNVTRNNRGLLMGDKDKEDLKNVSMPLGTLDHLQAQAQEHQASVSEIPLVVLTGISPSGLNATSEKEIEVFHDKVTARQEAEGTPNLSKIINLAQLNLWGEVDPEIGFVWEPLDTLDEGELATMRKTNMETATGYIAASVIDPLEARTTLAADADGPFASLDLSEEALPEPPAQTGEEDLDDDGPGKPDQSGQPQAGDAGEFNEGDHPRASNGKFGSGGGAGSEEEELAAATGRGNQAMQRVITGKTDVLGAMSRSEVGPIDFIWGDKHHGVAHIIERHGEHTALKMPEVIARGRLSIESSIRGRPRIKITHKGWVAALAPEHHGRQQHWLITGFEQEEGK